MSITLPQAPVPPGAVLVRPRIALEAYRLAGDCDWQAVAAWCQGMLHPAAGEHRPARIVVLTEDGPVPASAGDWIVRGLRRFMVCGPGEFSDRYEITGGADA